MQTSITGRHVTVTENVKHHVNDKLERCLGIFRGIEMIRVVLDKEKHLHVAEAVVQGAHHLHVVAKEKSENLYDAIDRAIEHVERQMHKERDRAMEHHHK